jgi:hypothetical protein
MLQFFFLKTNPKFLQAGSFSAVEHSFRWSAPTIPYQPPLDDTIVPLEAEDIPEMVALDGLTEPGPFPAPHGQARWVLGYSPRPSSRCDGWPTIIAKRLRGSEPRLHSP